MSNAPHQVAQRKLKYVWRALQLNPATQADQILRLRSIGLAMSDESAPRQSRQQRLGIRLRLNQIREKFWVSPTDQLEAMLEELPADPYPELKVSVQRMKRLCEVKPMFERLAQRKSRDINFVNTFKRICLLSPRRSGKVKERYLRNLATNPSIGKVKSTVQIIQEQFPRLYDVESDWFGQILLIESRQEEKETNQLAVMIDDGLEIPTYLIVVFVLFFVRLAVFFLRPW